MKILVDVILFIVGAGMGSFLCCQAWRWKYQEMGKKDLGKWSVCLKCKTRLKWYDNIPIVSWLVLGGKCRKCGAKIGVMEILAEVLMGVVFVMMFGGFLGGEISSYGVMDWAMFAVEVAFTMILGWLAICDGKWGELPNIGLILLNACGIIVLILKEWRLFLGSGAGAVFSLANLGNIGGAVLILGGVYWGLYLVSRGKWVGDGDFILGLAMAFYLGDSWLAIFVLFFQDNWLK